MENNLFQLTIVNRGGGAGVIHGTEEVLTQAFESYKKFLRDQVIFDEYHSSDTALVGTGFDKPKAPDPVLEIHGYENSAEKKPQTYVVSMDTVMVLILAPK